MNRIIIVAVLLLSQIVNAQNVNIKLSEPFEHANIFYISNFTTPSGDSTFYTFDYELKSEKYKRRYYSRNLKVQKEQELVYGLSGYSFCSYSFVGKSGIITS